MTYLTVNILFLSLLCIYDHFQGGQALQLLGGAYLSIIMIYRIGCVLSRRSRSAQISTEEQLNGYIALLNIRMAELGAMFYHIRRYELQDNCKVWPVALIEDYTWDLYDYEGEKARDKRAVILKNRARRLYEKRFSNVKFCYGDNPELTDLAMGLQYWVSSPTSQIHLLDKIRCESVLSTHVDTLIRNYRLWDCLTFGGSYYIIFRNWMPLSYLARERYELICRSWSQVWQSLEPMITIAQCSACPVAHEQLERLWGQLRLVTSVEHGLMTALQCGIDFSSVDERELIANLARNEVWKKRHGYSLPALSAENGSISSQWEHFFNENTHSIPPRDSDKTTMSKEVTNIQPKDRS